MVKEDIILQLPYSKPFLFVDEIVEVDTSQIIGTYRLDPSLDFYRGHFKDRPVTPGVILCEVMAQIGVVCFGIYLASGEKMEKRKIAMTSVEVEFIKPVFPGETVKVISEKRYFRFGKLKRDVKMQNENGETVCNGTIAGIMHD